jgi:hypothetical protein
MELFAAPRMSQFGPSRKSHDVRFLVAIGVKADLSRTSNFVGYYARGQRMVCTHQKDLPSKLKKFGSFLSLNFP